MSQVPTWLLRHTVQVEDFLGSNAVGDVYGAPYPVRCLLLRSPRMVRNGNGDEVMSSSSYIARPNHQPPPSSRVTLPTGDVASVIKFDQHTAPGLPTPDNTEVFLL